MLSPARIYHSPIGSLLIEANDKGICSIRYWDGEDILSDTHFSVLDQCISQLASYFDGGRRSFDVPLDLSKGTEFQQKVWSALLEIPYGTLESYMSLSQKLGNVKAIRAVASANGKNPIPIIVPCHRVIGSRGQLTGYGLGGIEIKRQLLQLENAHWPDEQAKLF